MKLDSRGIDSRSHRVPCARSQDEPRMCQGQPVNGVTVVRPRQVSSADTLPTAVVIVKAQTLPLWRRSCAAVRSASFASLIRTCIFCTYSTNVSLLSVIVSVCCATLLSLGAVGQCCYCVSVATAPPSVPTAETDHGGSAIGCPALSPGSFSSISVFRPYLCVGEE